MPKTNNMTTPEQSAWTRVPDGNTRESIYTKRVISHEEALGIAGRLINSHFRQEPCARVGIPARPDYDDDLLIMAYIHQQEELADQNKELVEALRVIRDSAICEEGETVDDLYHIVEACRDVARDALKKCTAIAALSRATAQEK